MKKLILAAMLGAMTSGIAIAQTADAPVDPAMPPAPTQEGSVPQGLPTDPAPTDPAVPPTDPAVPPADPAAPPQTQANPVGPGVPSPTPPAPGSAAEPVPPSMPADPSYQAGPYKGALTPPPAEAMNKEYPLCSKTVQDSCRNPGGV